MFYDAMLQIVRLDCYTYQVGCLFYYEILKQICFKRATLIVGNGKIGI